MTPASTSSGSHLRKLACVFVAWIGISVLSGSGPPEGQLPPGFVDEVYVRGLELASTLTLAPDGRLFVAERLDGRIRIVSAGMLEPEPYYTFDDVFVAGEVNRRGVFQPVLGYHGGLLGIAFDPQYPKTHVVYAFYTGQGEGGFGINRIVRLTGRERGGSPTVILDGIPGSRDHQSGRLEFGIDEKLFVTIGDLGIPELSQDPGAWDGKILRLEKDGSPARDNPFLDEPAYRPEIFALGIRSGFGLAVNPATGTLYESENGPTENDEVNRVPAGANLGHPLCGGRCGRADFTDPIFVWERVVAPTGIVYYDGDVFPPEYEGNLFVANWIEGQIVRLVLNADRTEVVDSSLFFDGDGPIYDLRLGRDGALYYLTSPNQAAGGSEVRRIRFEHGTEPTLSYTGNSRPGEFVSLGVSGPPGATVEHLYSYERRAGPMRTEQGALWLEEPITRAVLGVTDRDGRLTFTFPLPSWLDETTIYHQARVTAEGRSTLTPLVAEPVHPPVSEQ